MSHPDREESTTRGASPIDSTASTRTLVDVSPRPRRALPLLVTVLLAVALLAVSTSARAASDPLEQGERGATLTATAHVERGVVARPLRPPTASGTLVEARGTTMIAAATRSPAPLRAVSSRTPRYALLGVYRL